MQERRILTNIEQKGIPNSAVEITADNYSTVSGNVIYIPRNGYKGGIDYSSGNAYSTDSITLKFTGYPNIIKINNINFDTNSQRIPFFMNGYDRITLGGSDTYYRYSSYMNVRTSSSAVKIFTQEGIGNGANNMLPAVIDNEDIIYYDVIKLDKNIGISSLGANILSKHQPIYIDTE